MKYTTSAKNVEKCNLYQLGQVSFSFSGLFFAQGNPRETRYFLLILPKCKMVHYMKLTNICLTLLVNSFFSLCILPNSSEYALWCILAKLLTFCITIHYGAFSLTIFLHNCPHKSQVAAAGFPLLHFAHHHLCPGFVQRRADKSFLFNFSSCLLR